MVFGDCWRIYLNNYLNSLKHSFARFCLFQFALPNFWVQKLCLWLFTILSVFLIPYTIYFFTEKCLKVLIISSKTIVLKKIYRYSFPEYEIKTKTCFKREVNNNKEVNNKLIFFSFRSDFNQRKKLCVYHSIVIPY